MRRMGMAGWVLAAMIGMPGCSSRPEEAVVQVADRYYGLLQNGQTADAYALLPAEVRREMDWTAYQWLMDTLGLSGHRGVEWSEPRIDGEGGRIEGLVTTRNGSPLRQEVVCVRQGRTWVLRRAGEPSDTARNERIAEARERLPEAPELTALAADRLRGLADALRCGDFTEFHRDLAPSMRDRTTPDQLRDTFAWLAEPATGIDWDVMERPSPVFSVPPTVNEDGHLTLTGRIPMGEAALGFDLRFSREPPDWMLDSIILSPPR